MQKNTLSYFNLLAFTSKVKYSILLLYNLLYFASCIIQQQSLTCYTVALQDDHVTLFCISES